MAVNASPHAPAADRRRLGGSLQSVRALKQWWSRRRLLHLLQGNDLDESIRELSKSFDVPLEYAEAEFARAMRRSLYLQRTEFVRRVADLCWSDDPTIRESALELAKKSPLILSIRPDWSYDDV